MPAGGPEIAPKSGRPAPPQQRPRPGEVGAISHGRRPGRDVEKGRLSTKIKGGTQAAGRASPRGGPRGGGGQLQPRGRACPCLFSQRPRGPPGLGPGAQLPLVEVCDEALDVRQLAVQILAAPLLLAVVGVGLRGASWVRARGHPRARPPRPPTGLGAGLTFLILRYSCRIWPRVVCREQSRRRTMPRDNP